jgi:hypothetical protein
MNNNIENTFKFGKYYNPATDHYNNSNTSVVCDRCHRTNLKISIGLDETDLCLTCINDISHKSEQFKPMTKTSQGMDKFRTDEIHIPVTRMSQSMYKKPYEGMRMSTNMEQCMYKPQNDKYADITFMEQNNKYADITFMEQNMFNNDKGDY